MVDSMDMDREQRRYCIRTKHVVIICVTVLVCSLALGVGLGVGLSSSDTTTSTTPKPPPPPTEEPPPPGRGPCLPSTDSSGEWNNFRLPNYVNPTHYDLHLEPRPGQGHLQWHCGHPLKVNKPTRYLWLHIRETFVSAMPRLKMLNSQKEVSVKSCFEYKPQQYVVVEATEELPVTGPRKRCMSSAWTSRAG
ncbi:Glutamyl aminopeptidase [Nibea albiflora]|uniref:Glutamyl aminopeptidase n=1 Tax=Nibea albiflora TaxID=240163 RepID=A0ACB7FK26_NIBAL|nr:Glutamyl aminopeptidase [Nibea albiflora]